MSRPPSIEMEPVSHDSMEDPFLGANDAAVTTKSLRQKHSEASEPRALDASNPVRTGWPGSPISLKDSSTSPLLRLLPNVLFLFIPTAFYGTTHSPLFEVKKLTSETFLGFFVHSLNKKRDVPENSKGLKVVQATEIASTLWPILFAAVVGSMLKALTLYHAEKGTKLGTLEILSTSQTLVSTIRGCFSHRILGKWTVLLIIIWSLSPIGGLAVLRAVEKNFQSENFPMRYYPSDDLFSHLDSSPFNGASSAANAEKDMHRLVDSALSSPDALTLFSKGVSSSFNSAIIKLGGEASAAQSARTDLWGNIRIPFYHLLPGYNENQRDKWLNIPLTEIAPYSSLIGHTIRGIPQSSVGNFSSSMNTLYHSLSCIPWFNGSQWLEKNLGQLTWHKSTNFSIFSETQAQSGTQANIFFDILSSRTYSADTTEDKVENAILVFGAKASGKINMTHCEVTPIYAETKFSCTRAWLNSTISCTATRMRERVGVSATWSALNMRYAASLGLFLLYIPNTIQSTHHSEASGLELYLRDPPTSLTGYEYPDYGDIPMKTFQSRLALIVNTFYHATLNATNFLGADGVARYDVPPYQQPQYGNATGMWTEFTPSRYEVHYGWLGLYLVATTVLAVCAVATVAITAMTRAPDLFTGVSSLTRDAAFVTGIPGGGSALAGAERARELRELWVRIQDVKPEADVGRIAFSDQKDGNGAGALRWERRYE